MSHQRTGYKLSRKKGQRIALIKTMAGSLIRNGKIKTTLVKAKAMKPYVERLVTHAKKDGLKGTRLVVERTGNANLARVLTTKIAPRYSERNGGYVRIIKLGRRKSDGAEMAMVEFV